MRHPPDPCLDAERNAIADECSHAATSGESAFGRDECAAHELLTRPEHTTTGDDEWRDRARAAVHRRARVPCQVASDDEVTVVLPVDVGDFGAEADSRREIHTT